MKHPVFKDQTLQQQFDMDGFVKLRLFYASEIETLSSLLRKQFPEEIDNFFSSSYLDSFELKEKISNRIVEIIAPSIKKHFIDYRLIGAAFLIKGIGVKSEMPMHQDWTIVDESRYYAANVWIPLLPTNESNGTIEVMKGSHLWNQTLRAPTIPFCFNGYQDQLKKELTPVDTKLGEVVILNQAVIHYSKPNFSSQIRPAITSALVSKQASLMFHYWDKQKPGEIDVYSQEDDFLLRFENFHQSIFERPMVGKLIKQMSYKLPQMNEEKLNQLLGRIETKSRKGFFKRLFLGK